MGKKASKDPEVRGDTLASEINTQLNREFPEEQLYREALEAAISHLQVVLDALDDDAKAKGYGHGV